MKKLLLVILIFLPSLYGYSQDFNKKMAEYGLVDIQALDSTIKVRLIYSTKDNFVGKDMYGSLNKAYAQPEIAQMVVKAQGILRGKYPDLCLLVCDAARPISVQAQMFKVVAGTPNNIYVANPAKGGGRHNYGTAVDVTIVDSQGIELDMGSLVDHFGARAHVDATDKGLLSKKAAANRKLLIDIMQSVGFTVHPKEWWHFHKYTVLELKSKYKLLDF